VCAWTVSLLLSQFEPKLSFHHWNLFSCCGLRPIRNLLTASPTLFNPIPPAHWRRLE